MVLMLILGFVCTSALSKAAYDGVIFTADGTYIPGNSIILSNSKTLPIFRVSQQIFELIPHLQDLHWYSSMF